MASLSVYSLNVRSLTSNKKFIKTIISRNSYDFVLLQETYIKNERDAQNLTTFLGINDYVFSYGNRKNGTCILNISNKFNIINKSADLEGRWVIATIQNEYKTFTLINIYAPADKKFQQVYYENLHQTITNFHHTHPIILGGDFNNTENRDGHTPFFRTLQYTLTTYQLTDTYGTLHPDSGDTTHTSKTWNTSARLDRIYAHRQITPITSQHCHDTLKFTDHSAINTIFQITNEQVRIQTKQKRSPHWKFNNTLLENEIYVKHITTTIRTHLDDLEIEEENNRVGLLWETLKENIIAESKQIAAYIQKQKRNTLNELLAALEIAKYNKQYTEAHLLQEQIHNINLERYKGAHIRTKTHNDINEAPTKEFLSTENNIQNGRQIKKIRDINGNIHTEPKDITNAFKDFYHKLFTKERTNSTIQDEFLLHARPLQDQDKENLNTPITIQNLNCALSDMKPNKSPGPDGLTSEFYKHFFDLLSPLFLKMIEESHRNKQLPPSLNRSYITIIPKDSPDKTQLKNYRPISLLNIDYKIISKTITNKLKPYMSKLIHPDQQCAVQGRKIQNHLHFIRDFITYTQDKPTPGAIISLDQEKAFDRVSHEYLHKTTHAYNLGTYLETWIQTLYKQPESQILVNHTLSETFQLTRSIRQGCSLSPLLYILTLEPLLEHIRQTHKGIRIPGKRTATQLAYADDTTFFTETHDDIEHIINTFNRFGQGSGSKLNTAKSVAFGLGHWKNKSDYPFDIQATQNLKIYGITFTHSTTQTPTETWTKIVTKTRTLLAYYGRLYTTIFSRAYIVNTTIISKIIYIATIINIPNEIIIQLNAEIRQFIFLGTIHCISKETLAQHKTQGGIQLQHITTKITSLRINYISEIIKNKDAFPLAHYYLGLRLIKHTPLSNNTPHHFGRSLPSFYKTCAQALLKHPDLIGKTTKQVYTEIIKDKATPLHERLKTAYRYTLTDCTPCFINTHNKYSTASEKQTTYRILFNMTPIRPTIKPCIYCNRKPFNEEHLFAKCIELSSIRDALKETLTQLTGQDVNIHKAIMLNIFPKTSYKTSQLISHLLGKYRHLLWTTYSRHKINGLTSRTLNTIWTKTEEITIISHTDMNLDK